MSSIAKLENNTTLDNDARVRAEETFRFLVSLELDRSIPSALRNLIGNYVLEFTTEEPVSLLIVAPNEISTQQEAEIREAIEEVGVSTITCADIEVANTNENPTLPFRVAVIGEPAAFASGLPQVPGTRDALRQAFSASVALRTAAETN